jgi:aspartyl-tRNA(Asn)/glutamyl-tRNA(Gln) amidotransferase subunit B
MATTAATPYETIIGIEVHAQLRTESKMFCGCPTSAPPGEPDEPNTRVCPVCLGMPGTLPVINRRAVELVIRTGIALDCHVETEAVRFERKNYFYPDLPKGYQISQYALPLCSNGRLSVPVPAEGGAVSIGITRAHLEEDTARLQHGGRGYSLVDFNRAGVPLMEIVTEPDVRSPAQARAYGETLRDILRHIGASDGDMETGSMRIEGNISLRPMGASSFGTKVEVKNLNSFRSLERAMEFEVDRHAEALQRDEPLVQETRGWDEHAGRTISQRSKEEANDYRYFPDPDLPPMVVDGKMMGQILRSLPELPAARFARYLREHGLSPDDARTIISDRPLAEYFEGVVRSHPGDRSGRTIANWMLTELLGALNADGKDIGESPMPPGSLSELIRMVEDGTISGKIGKEIFEESYKTGEAPRAIVERRGVQQISDEAALWEIVDQVVGANSKQAEAYAAGKDGLFGFFVGQVMKATQGRANPVITSDLLHKRLGR